MELNVDDLGPGVIVVASQLADLSFGLGLHATKLVASLRFGAHDVVELQVERGRATEGQPREMPSWEDWTAGI